MSYNDSPCNIICCCVLIPYLLPVHGTALLVKPHEPDPKMMFCITARVHELADHPQAAGAVGMGENTWYSTSKSPVLVVIFHVYSSCSTSFEILSLCPVVPAGCGRAGIRPWGGAQHDCVRFLIFLCLLYSFSTASLPEPERQGHLMFE